MNEEDDIGQMYSGSWIRHHLSLATMVVGIPNQYRDIAKMPKEEQHHWRAACEEEMKSLKEWKVWDLVDLPEGCRPVGNHWVFARKSNGQYKAHLVAQGFTQAFRIDYQDTFSPIAHFEMFRTLMALMVLHDWELEALNVKTAFLYRNLDEEIYMKQPECFILKGREKQVCRLKKSLYGLKQAALQWNKELHKSLLEMGFHCTYVDPGTYVKFIDKEIIIILVYVDDALFTGSNPKLLSSHKKQFMKQWESRDLGEVKEYLGIQIIRD